MSIFSQPSAKPLLEVPKEKLAKIYTRYRVQVFISIFLGYAGYYFIRNGLSIVAKATELSNTEIGLITCGMYLSYGVSKFVSGMISDKSNIKLFLPLGLFLSGLLNIFIGSIPVFTQSILAFSVCYFINGWIQGMGYPPGAKTLVFWYSPKERMTWATAWNLAHNVGAALAPIFIGVALGWGWSTFQSSFTFPGICSCILAVVLYFTMQDRPASLGLPDIHDYKNDQPLATQKTEARVLTMGQVVVEHILPNKKLIYACFFGAFVYILRYGVVSWAPKFLSTDKQLDMAKGMAGFSVFEIAGIIGMITAGFLSQKLFKRSKPLTNVAYLSCGAILLVIYYFVPAGDAYAWLDYICLVGLGICIYGPVMMVGLYSMDLVAKEVAGAASGLAGTFSYILGGITATLGIGIVVDNLGWIAGFGMFIGSAILAIIFTLLSRDKSLEKH